MRKRPGTHFRASLLAGLLLAGSGPGWAAEALGDEFERLSIWPDGPPGRQSAPTQQTVTERDEPSGLRDRYVTGVTDPSLAVFRAEQPGGAALLIVPGGGYQRVVLDKEGYETAQWFASRGVTCFVLVYRLPGESWTAGPDTPLQDTQRAMRWLRGNAAEFGIDPGRLGVVGFSAGGHAAATLLTRFDKPVYDAVDALDEQSARPDFGALIYPVISMQDGLAHAGSRDRLLGPDYAAANLADHSPERHVGPDIPPVFLLHAGDDGAVAVGNSLVMYAALLEAGARADLHVFAEGGHGFGLRYTSGKPVAAWPELLLAWLAALP